MIVTYVLYGFDTAQRYRQSMDETLASSLRHLVLPRIVKNTWKNWPLLLADVVQDGCAQGLFACPDSLTAARTLMTCIGALSPTNLSPRELGEREEIETRTNQIIDLVLQGLCVRS